MAKKTKVKKPVGTSGVTRISRNAAGHETDFQKVEFPSQKELIEAEIVMGFVASAREILPQLSAPAFEQNEQDDFDFNLLLADGTKKHLELKEIAPLMRGPYDAAAASYMVYDFATLIRKMILKQSARYKGSTGSGLYLLLHVTDWRFRLSPSVVTLLCYWALRNPHCFQRIYVYQVRERREGFAGIIYPEAVPTGFDPESLRHNRVQNADPTKMRELPCGGIGWKFDD